MQTAIATPGDSRAVSVLIPAFNAQDSIAATIQAAAALPGVTEVIVVDDGSTDATTAQARETGAQIICLPHNQGKGAAICHGLASATGELVLLLDADLGASAALAGPLIEPLRQGTAEMTVAHFVRASDDPTPRAGFGLVVKLARGGIRALTGLTMQSPLSGQRCLPRTLLAETGLAERFGIEVGLTVEVFRRGGRILEVPLAMTHAATGRDLAGFIHRGRQFANVLSVLAATFYGVGWAGLSRGQVRLRMLVWLAVMAGLLGLTPWRELTGASLLLSLLFIPPLTALLVRRGQLRPNYRGLRLVGSFGLLFFPVWLLLTPWRSATLDPGLAHAALLLMLSWPALGLLDDLGGSAGARGFKGHLKALFAGKLTTGAAKLIVGGLVSLLAGWWLSSGNLLVALLNGLLIALCTNFLNLLDLRPGRALKGFCLLGAGAWVLGSPALVLLMPLFGGVVAYGPLDLAGRAMLGDAGANPLGAMVGLALAAGLDLPGKVIFLALLVAVHLYAERASLSNLIDRLAPLRWLDRLGRAESVR